MLTLGDVTPYMKTASHLGGMQVALTTDLTDKSLSDKVRQIHNLLEVEDEILSVRIFSKHKELGYIDRNEFIDLSLFNERLLTGATASDVPSGAGNLFLPGLDPDLGTHYVCPNCGADLFVLPEDEDSIEMPPKCNNTSKHSEPVSMNLK